MKDELKKILHAHYLKMQEHYDEYKNIQTKLLDEATNGVNILTFDNFLKLQREIDHIQFSGWQFLQIYRNKKELDEGILEMGKPLLLRGHMLHCREVFDTKRKLPSIPDIVKKLAYRVIDLYKNEILIEGGI